MNRFITWSRNKIIGKKEEYTCEDKVDGLMRPERIETGRQERGEVCRQERILMIQWKEEDAPDKCLSQLSDDSAFSSSGCIVHDPSSQLDSDSARGDHHFNCSLDQDDLSDEELHQTNIELLNSPEGVLKREANEKSFSSLPSQFKPLSILDSQTIAASTDHGGSVSTFEKPPHELLRSISVETENKKVRFRDRFRRISRLGLDKERNTICFDPSHQYNSDQSSPDLDRFDIWVSSSFSPKPDSMIEVVRVDPFMRARILSFSGAVTSPSASSSSSSPVAILQCCSKNKDISFEKEFQKCLKKGAVKKAGKRVKYCFLFESFLLITKQKSFSLFQLKHVITLKLLWISLRRSDDPDDDRAGHDDDRAGHDDDRAGHDDDRGIMLFKQSIESTDDNDKDDDNDDKKDKVENLRENNVNKNYDNNSDNHVYSSIFSVNKASSNDNFENKINVSTINYNSNVVESNVNNNTNPNNDDINLFVTIGWINEKIHLKNISFQSESDKKSWITAIKMQQELVCSSMDKTLIIKVQCYDKQLGTQTKKLEVGRSDTMKEVLEKFHRKGISFISDNLSEYNFGVKFVDNVEKYYLNGSESMFVLQLASEKGLLNGKIDCFTVSQARIPSISKQINARRRRIKRTTRLELGREFLAYNHARAPFNKCRLFGCNLQEFCVANNNKIPSIILKLLRILHDKGPEAEGIFRKSHSQRELKDKVCKFNSFRGSLEGPELDTLSVHMAAAIVKYWLMKLKDCLMMSKYYFKWLEIGRMSEKEKEIEEYQKLSKKLPPCHLLLLKYLMSVLHRISSSAHLNLMSHRNLAVCLGPSILKPSSLVDVNQEKDSVETANDVVETLIRESNAIFGGVDRIDIFEEGVVELPEEEWSVANRKVDKQTNGERIKFKSCENLDCGVKEEEEEEEDSRMRANSFALVTKPSHPPLIRLISTPDSGINECSQDTASNKMGSSLNMAEAFKENKDHLFQYTDTTNTDESVSEDSFYQQISLAKIAIVNNFVKNANIVNESVKTNKEVQLEKNQMPLSEVVTEVLKKIDDPKIPTKISKVSSFSEVSRTANQRDKNKESFSMAKDGSASSDSDTLTKGSCIVSNVNSPAITTSKKSFDYSPNKVLKKSRSKSTSKRDKAESQEQPSNHSKSLKKPTKNVSILPKKSNSFSSHAFNTTTSLPKPLEINDEQIYIPTIKNRITSLQTSSSFMLRIDKHQQPRKLPQITEATFRDDRRQQKEKQNNYSLNHKASIVKDKKMNFVEQQIQNFQECEQLLYKSLQNNGSKESPKKTETPSKEKITPIKTTPIVSSAPKHSNTDSFATKPKYILEVDVGNIKTNINNINGINNRSRNFDNAQVSKASKLKFTDNLRRNVISSNLSLAEPTLYTQQPSMLPYVNNKYKHAFNKNRINKANSINPTLTNTNEHSLKNSFFHGRSKTPTPQKSVYNAASNHTPLNSNIEQYGNLHSPSNNLRRETASALDYQIKPKLNKKRFVTSVYLNSDAGMCDFKNDSMQSKEIFYPSSIQAYKPSVYRSTFTLNF